MLLPALLGCPDDPPSTVDTIETTDVLPAAADSLANAHASFLGQGSYATGNAVAFGGDPDGDGVDDVLVAADFEGLACIFTGPVAAGTHAVDDADTCYAGEEDRDYAGVAVASGGDVDGDGGADTLIGAFANSEAGANAGKTYLLSAPHPGGLVSLAGARASWLGESEGDFSGGALDFAGDVDGDGDDDVLVGAMSNTSGGSGAGKAYLFRMPHAGGTLAEADVAILGEGPTDDTTAELWHGAPAAGDGVGSVLAGAGDFDGDGLADIALGANGNDTGGTDAGIVAIFLGPLADGEHELESADRRWYGEQSLRYAGDALAAVGDLDGDGYGEILASGQGDSPGITWVLSGPGTTEAGVVTDAAVSFTGELDTDQAGAAVAGAGDADGDGKLDLFIGAYGSDNVALDAGVAYLVHGPFDPGAYSLGGADRAFLGEAQGDNAGRAVAGGGDADGDGVADLLVGALYNDEGGAFSGKAYLLLGPF